MKTKTGQVLTGDVMGHSGHPDRPVSTRRGVINSKLDICANAVRMPTEQREHIREAWWKVAEASDIGVAMATMREFGSLR